METKPKRPWYLIGLLILLLSTFPSYGSLLMAQQSRKVTGTVLDYAKEPIIGANVILKGTSRGVITDVKGEFTLDNVTTVSIIQISYIGYKTKEITVGQQKNLVVMLSEDSENLDEVVVVGYGTQKRASITGSVANIVSKELTAVKTGSVANTLVGRLPGLRAVQRSGAPGENIPEMDIRGFGNALIIVDGVERSFAKLDPNDVESISILKDASAAVYGSKGANGVILVTTKKGTESKPKFEYSGWYGFQRMTRYPEVYNSYQYAMLSNEAANNIGLADVYNEEKMEKFRTGDGEFYKSTNWLHAITRDNAPETSHNFSVKGGNEYARYYLSAGVMDQQSYFRSNDWNNRRYSMHAHIGTTLAKGLDVDVLLTAQSDRRNVSGGSGVFQSIQQAKPFGSPYYFDEPVGPLRSTFKEYGQGIFDERYLNSSLDINWEIPWVKGLKAKAKMSYDFRNYKNKNFNPKDPYTYEPTESGEIVKAEVGSTVGKLNQEMGNNITKDMQFSLNYTRTFGKHDISAMAMYQATNPSYEWMTGFREFMINSLPVLNAGNDLKQNNGGTEGSSLVMALIGRVNYAYANKYMIEGVLRYDGSSTFAPDKRWGTFPSVSIGWRISEESFFEPAKTVVDDMKLRVSYGTMGNQSIGSYYPYVAAVNSLSGTVNYWFDKKLTTGIAQAQLANELITWEKSKQFDVGLDLTLFKSRLSLTADYYIRNISGMLQQFDLPDFVGMSAPWQNAGSMRNNGWEVSIGWQDKIGDLSYYVKANLSDVKNTVTNLYGKEYDSSPTITREGEALGSYYGYVADGYFQSQEEIDMADCVYGGNKANIKPGYIRYVDVNHDGEINSKDRVILGNSTPRYEYSFTLGGQWKGIDLSLFFQGVGKRDLYYSGAGARPLVQNSTIFKSQLDTWSPENPDAEYPLLLVDAGSTNMNNIVSSFWIKSGAYLRLKNLTVGYTLPKKWTNRVSIDNLRLYFTASNLFTINSGYKGYDPETGVTSGAMYPVMKTFNFGINLDF